MMGSRRVVKEIEVARIVGNWKNDESVYLVLAASAYQYLPLRYQAPEFSSRHNVIRVFVKCTKEGVKDKIEICVKCHAQGTVNLLSWKLTAKDAVIHGMNMESQFRQHRIYRFRAIPCDPVQHCDGRPGCPFQKRPEVRHIVRIEVQPSEVPLVVKEAHTPF